MSNLGLKINLETIVSCRSFCFMQKKIGPNCAGLYSVYWGWFRVVQTRDRCVWYAWLGWLQQHCWAILIFVLYAPLCRMQQTWNGKASLLPNKKKTWKIGTRSVPTSVLEYQEISTKICCLQHGSYEREKSYKETKKIQFYQVETSTDLWWLWLKIPLENQMKKHVLWIKKRKLYISAFGACSYNNIDMLCDFMR